ncbi:DUF2637 domain-containing protein [Nocardia sp. NBC_01499]|uniref:DUF2637 domain-containing protein n=1 Tax=Nocardia sp. NBC_01499 TaxID=2903597 RepID=UPI00386DE4EE
MSAADQSAGMRWARWSAVVIIVIIGAAAFVLSFAALRDLAILANTPKRWAWLFPVIVDGTIIQATVSALVLAKSPERRWFLWVLGTGAMVSIAGNSLHAVAAGRILPWWASALVAAIAPISLLVDTHGLAVLFRAAQHDSAPAPELMPEPIPEPASEPIAVPVSQEAPNRSVSRRRAVSPRRDPAKVARAAALRAEGKTYAEIGKALDVSPRTAANYASKPKSATTAAESRPPTPAAASVASVQSIHSSRPAQQQLLPIAVPVGGN